MKRTITSIIALALALVFVLSLAACGDDSSSDKSSNSSSSSSSKSGSSSGSKLESMSESTKEKKVNLAAMEDAIGKLKSYYTFDEDQTGYKIGSCKRVKERDTSEEWAVSGTLFLYDKYGSIVETAKFSYDCIVIDKDGYAFSFGHYEVDAGSHHLHN